MVGDRPPQEGTVAEIRRGRYGAEIDGDFVVFLIGARLNRPLEARVVDADEINHRIRRRNFFHAF